jgi:hypothetical protein
VPPRSSARNGDDDLLGERARHDVDALAPDRPGIVVGDATAKLAYLASGVASTASIEKR